MMIRYVNMYEGEREERKIVKTFEKCQCYRGMEKLALMHVSGQGGHLALPDTVPPTME